MFTITPPPPPHLVWEVVGSEVVILDTTSHTTHRLTGDLARSFLAVTSGEPISSREVVALQERGFLEPRPPVSRRTLMAGGVAGLGLGITSLSLPTVAQASSNELKPTLTAASLVAGQWRWGPAQFGINVSPTSTDGFLTGVDEFRLGDNWRLTLAVLNGSPAEAANSVVQLIGGELQVVFEFTITPVAYPDNNTILLGTLERLTPPPVLSEQFPIPKL